MIKDDMKRRILSNLYFDGEYGIEIEAESKESYPIKKFSFWDVKEDNSLRDFGREYVLKAPVMYGDQLTEALMEFHDKTKKVNFIQDSNSTSVHVHCNILPETWQTVANFLTIYTLIEGLLMEVAGDSRRNNLFCLPIKSVPLINKISVDLFKMVQKKQFDFSRMMDPNSVKYAALNLATIFKFGSLEVRSFRGVTDVEIIQAWIDLLHTIRVFSREDVTPPEILDQFRKKGKKYLKEIFKDGWSELQHENEDKLLMENLWFAGHLGYNFTPIEWRKLDVPEPDPIIPAGITMEDLINQAIRFFGQTYEALSNYNKQQCIGLVMMNKKMRKPKKTFSAADYNLYGPITEEIMIPITQPANFAAQPQTLVISEDNE